MAEPTLPPDGPDNLVRHYFRRIDNIYDAIHDNVATKADLRELEQRLDSQFEAMNIRFEQVERTIDAMVVRIVAAIVVALVILFAALHYWSPHG